MKAKYGGETSPCSPISSNCVIWQGPDIPCINLCNGDTISDIVYKLAEKLCDIIGSTATVNPDVSGLNLKCLPQSTQLELEPVLQSIIDYICNLDVNGGTGSSLPFITLPECLRFNDNLGNPVTSLPLDEFAQLLGNNICTILSDINSINLAIASLDRRITILENCVLPCESTAPNDPIQVLSSCLFPGTLVSISDLILTLETQFCELRTLIGTTSVINAAISAQCIFGNTPKLSGEGTYSGLSSWVNSPTTLSESNINQWLAICDLYAAVKNIQDNCCGSSCDTVNFAFSYNTIDNNGDNVIEELNLNFTASSIPSGFSDCNNGTNITITDSDGSLITETVNVTNLSSNSAGVNVDITSLNNLSSLVLTVPFCVTDGSNTCTDTQTVIIPLSIPCPTDITGTVNGSDIDVTFTNNLGTGVSYTITASDAATGSILGTTIVANPDTNVAYTFT